MGELTKVVTIVPGWMFDVEGFLSNSLTLEMNARSSVPGQTVDIEMRSKPNSFIGLLAIDKSVRALKSGHDIEQADLLNEIKSYDVGQETSFYPWVQTIKSSEDTILKDVDIPVTVNKTE